MTDYERGKADGRRETLGELKAVFQAKSEKAVIEYRDAKPGSIDRLGWFKKEQGIRECMNEIESREAADDESNR